MRSGERAMGGLIASTPYQTCPDTRKGPPGFTFPLQLVCAFLPRQDFHWRVEDGVSTDFLILGTIALVGTLGIIFLCWVLGELIKEGRKQSKEEDSVERIRRRIATARLEARR